MAFTSEFRLRELRKILQGIRANGLAPQAFHPLEAAAVLMFASDLLGDKPGAGASTKLLRGLAGIHDKANSVGLANIPGIACRKGCDHCCSTFVSAGATSIFAIADYIRANPSSPAFARNRLAELEAATRGLTIDTREGQGRKCPFLHDHICSVYPVRPPACRGYMSGDVEACRTAETMKGAPDIPMPQFSIAYRSVIDQALWALLHSRGLPRHSYEIGEGVMRVLDDPGAEERWFNGEDVFAGVQIDDSGSKSMPAGMEENNWKQLITMSRGEPMPSNKVLMRALPRWVFA